MKKLATALLFCLIGKAQTFPATFLGLPPPPPIATYRGPAGSTDRYYWLVARYPGFIYSAVSTTAAHVVTVAQLDLGSRVDLSWQPVFGAIGYDLLETSTNSAPTGACNCAVSVNNISAVYDDGHNLLAYTVATAASSGGSGTVTSITAGTGLTLTPNPIIATGTVAIANTAVTPASYTNASLTVNQQGQITAASNGTAPVTSVTGTSPIASSGGATPAISLNDTAVTPGAYTNVSLTVDQKGRLTAASSGTTPVTSVTGTSPVVSSGGATPAISCPTCTVGGATGTGTTNQATYWSGSTTLGSSATLRRVPVSGNDWGVGTSGNGFGFGVASGDCYNLTAQTDTGPANANVVLRGCQTAGTVLNTRNATFGSLGVDGSFAAYWGNIIGTSQLGFGVGTVSANAASQVVIGNGSFLLWKDPAGLTDSGVFNQDAVKISGSTIARMTTSDISGAVGIVQAASGGPFIATEGNVCIQLDNSPTAGDYVVPSSTTTANGHDAGASRPVCGTQIYGRVGAFGAGGGPCGGSSTEIFMNLDSNTCGGSSGPATATNCSSSASPAVCGSASAGSVNIAAAATTVTVNTTAVTANSQILVMYDSSLGTKLGVTCNTTEPALYGVTARTAATSFVITATSPITNPACFSYLIVN